jgi:hypothetical protein
MLHQVEGVTPKPSTLGLYTILRIFPYLNPEQNTSRVTQEHADERTSGA